MHTFLLLKALITRIGLVYLPQESGHQNSYLIKSKKNTTQILRTRRENLIDVENSYCEIAVLPILIIFLETWQWQH